MDLRLLFKKYLLIYVRVSYNIPVKINLLACLLVMKLCKLILINDYGLILPQVGIKIIIYLVINN